MKARTNDRIDAVTCDESPSAPDGSLLVDLSRLLARIDRGREDPPTPDRAHPPATCWEDDGYYYLEAAFPEGRGREADISIHRSKVFLRMEK